VCLWRRILGRLVRQRQPAALGTTAALAALSSRFGMLGKLSIAGAVAAILMIPTALSAQVGGAVNRTPPTPFLDSY
jgi:hypothetical protein